MKIISAFLLFVVIVISSCKKNNDPAPVEPVNPATEAYYYPPLTGDSWDSKTAASVGWDASQLQAAFDYAGTKNSYGMVLLQHGKIVKEQYWNGWNINTVYYLASAGKSVLSFLTGIAQHEGIVNINSKSSQYLGTGWTVEPLAKENLITVKNELTMTTGLEDNVPDQDCLSPSCLIYKADAGTRWAYHNAPYRLLQNVLANASGMTINQYSRQKLFDKIGMARSTWINYVLYSTTREAARFGSMMLRGGKWNDVSLFNDDAYFSAMTNTSQSFNQSYGYLWWLNGKSSFMAPQTQVTFPGSLVPAAPADMIMALGKDDKKIYVIPSLDAVLVRLGDNATGTATLGPSSFDNELWSRLRLAMHY